MFLSLLCSVYINTFHFCVNIISLLYINILEKFLLCYYREGKLMSTQKWRVLRSTELTELNLTWPIPLHNPAGGRYININTSTPKSVDIELQFQFWH